MRRREFDWSLALLVFLCSIVGALSLLLIFGFVKDHV